jgi:hypothetical protein
MVTDAHFLELGGKVLAPCDTNDGVVLAVADIIELYAGILEGLGQINTNPKSLLLVPCAEPVSQNSAT